MSISLTHHERLQKSLTRSVHSMPMLGVVLTASHNPAHDNGFKAYFNQGAQLVEPNASGVINEVNAITSEAYDVLAEGEQGTLHVLAADMDRVYMDDAKSLLLRPDLMQGGEDKTKVVFTNLHGTGGHCIVPLLDELGFEVLTVPEQDIQDGRFPTVDSPNPENGPALAMGIALANETRSRDCHRHRSRL